MTRSAPPKDEEQALRRIATLVAIGVPAEEIFAAVVGETQRLLEADDVGLLRFEPDGTVTALANAGGARGQGSAVEAPIVVDGLLWGTLVASFRAERGPQLKRDAERLVQFSELLALAIANAESWSAVSEVADEQAILRRAATLVAEERSPREIFTSVAPELVELVDAETISLVRLGQERLPIELATYPERGPGEARRSELSFESGPIVEAMRDDGAPALIALEQGDLVDAEVSQGLRTVAGAPIVVHGRLWGMTAAGWRVDASELPGDPLGRLAEFCRLLVTSIANRDSREALRRVADEQAALRRIATLTAEARDPEEIFAVVVAEACRVLDADNARLMRVTDDGESGVIVATSGHPAAGFQVGMTVSLAGEASPDLTREGRTVRVDTARLADGWLRLRLGQLGFRTATHGPILVDDRLWGVLAVSWRAEEPIGRIEEYVSHFASSVATAIREASDREAIAALASAQAGLRRVATVVAQGAAPIEVFRVIAVEVKQLMGVDASMLTRFEPDGRAVVLSHATAVPTPVNEGDVLSLVGDSATARVYRSGRPARITSYRGVAGEIAAIQRTVGHTSSAGAPVMIEGQLWGAIVATWRAEQPMPPGAEDRLAEFTALIAVAIANSESRAELAASRMRVVIASDDARRRVQRDLHDGAQQRLVSLAIQLREAQHSARKLVGDDKSIDALFEGFAHELTEAGEELQSLARGLHPAALDHGGLERALRSLTRRSPIPVTLTLNLAERLPEPLEIACYYVVSETLANAIMHARATTLAVDVEQVGDEVTLTASDDGVGGADATRGTGLIGLRDRVEALGGRLEVVSPAGGGTSIVMRVGSAQRVPPLAALPRL
jgi:signal transduction histidine kinase